MNKYFSSAAVFCLSFSLLCIRLQMLQAQSDCDILGAIDGTLNGWDGSGGTWHEQTNPDMVIYNNNTFYGIVNGRHTVRNPSDGNVWWITAQNIPYVFPGDAHSIQLGNWDNGKQWERLRRTISVDSFNALLKLKIAVFLEDKGHIPIRQPKFWLKIFDENGNLIKCGDYQVEAGNIPGFLTQPKQTINGVKFQKIRYLPWTTVSADLRDYIGQNITLEFSTFDCSEGEHFGCALFEIECQKAEITATPFCPSGYNFVKLSAPAGFSGYYWSNGANTQNITVQNPQPGQTFTVTFVPFSTLTGDCTISMSYTIPDEPQLSLPSDVNRCEGDLPTSVTVSGPAGYTYTWSNGANGASTFAGSPGPLTVMGTDGYCTITAGMQVNEAARPKFHLESVDPLCYGYTGDLFAVADAPDSSNYSYAWSNGPLTSANEDILAGSYTVTVTNNSICQEMKFAVITQPDPAVLTLSHTPDYCDQHIATITTSIQGQFPPYAFQLNNLPAQSANAFTDLPAGGYSITAIDANGCPFTDSILIPNIPGPAIASIETHNTTCGEDNGSCLIILNGGTAPFQYQIAGIGVQNAPAFEMLPPGVFGVAVTDYTGCTATAAIDILGSTAPVLQHIEVHASTCDLPNGSLIVEANGGKQPLEFGVGGIVFQPTEILEGLPAGNLQVFIRDQYDCKDSVMVEIPAIASPSLEIDLTPPVCGLDNAALHITGQGGIGTLLFSLDGISFSTQKEYTALSPGKYIVYVEDTDGCRREKTVDIPASSKLVIEHTEIDLVECRRQNGALTVIASGGSGDRRYAINGGQYQTGNRFLYLAQGEYLLSVKDAAGCTDSTLVTMETDCMYIPNVFSPSNDGQNDEFRIFAKDNADFDVVFYEIYDRWGDLIHRFANRKINDESVPWWNGRRYNTGKKVALGAYVYCIKVDTGDLVPLLFTGSVTVLR